MPCKGHGGIEGVAIAVAPTTTKVVAGLGTSGGVVALVQEEEVVTPTMTTLILLKKPPRMTEDWEMRRGMLDSSTMCVTKMTMAQLEVTAPTTSGTDEGSNEDIAADAEVKDPEQQQQEASKTPSLPKRRKQIGGGTKDWVKVKEWVNPTIYPARTRMATRKLLSSTSGGATTEQQEQAQGEDAVLFLGDDQESDDEEPAYCFYAPIQPPSRNHALAGPQRGKWLVSRDAEYNSQMENHTWDLVYLPNGKKAIQCKWLAKIKTDEKGEPSVYKSRLVAKGFQQKEKEDYKEVFAPTAKSPTLRVLLAVAAVRKWKLVDTSAWWEVGL
ncbi:hypothetical protein CLOM_g1707 [Closterium sp. NIES-68]|nr:hypothetical protein CLOM_g1707 [Closterium sp. NIES-68]